MRLPVDTRLVLCFCNDHENARKPWLLDRQEDLYHLEVRFRELASGMILVCTIILSCFRRFAACL
jgi:hypothetical protein